MTSETLTTAKRELRETKATIRAEQDKARALERVIDALSDNGTRRARKRARVGGNKRVNDVLDIMRKNPKGVFTSGSLSRSGVGPQSSMANALRALVKKGNAVELPERGARGAVQYRYKETTLHPQ